METRTALISDGKTDNSMPAKIHLTEDVDNGSARNIVLSTQQDTSKLASRKPFPKMVSADIPVRQPDDGSIYDNFGASK